MDQTLNRNQAHWNLAAEYLPGGVCSSARIHHGLDSPFYISRAEGSKVYDLEGNEYVDRIAETVPCIEMLRFTLSGTETTYYVVKLAREYTGRPLVVKFEGHFHGFNDYLAYNYWPSSGQAWPQTTPAMAGLPEYLQQGCIVLPFNDYERAEETLSTRGEEIAAVILEPVNYNSGTLLPEPGFLELLRCLTAEQGILLIFDEILSGFRTGPGCMQATYGVTPDLCTLGKTIGGGMPLSAFGGKRQIMEHVSPLGKAQHSGTYNGHLTSIMAGIAFLEVIGEPGFYESLLSRCQRLYDGLEEIIQRLGFVGRTQGLGARFSFLFGPPAAREKIRNYQDVMDNDWSLFHRFCVACLRHGVYIHTMWHHGISAAHTDEDIERILEGIDAALMDV
jgi:glutamate-1-semialdehyde 2,1-aminomutase